MSAVKGQKGKDGGAARTPIEEPNTLHTNSKAYIDYLLSEGPIGGLVNGGQSIFVDGTPLLDARGNANFKGVDFNERYGYPDQTFVSGFNAVAREVGVGAQLLYNQNMIRTIEDTNLDAINIKIRIPTLVKYIEKGDKAGDRVKTSVSHRIWVKPSDGGYQQVVLNRTYQSTSSPTASNITGLKITLSKNYTGKFDELITDTLSFRYREVGSSSWKTVAKNGSTRLIPSATDSSTYYYDVFGKLWRRGLTGQTTCVSASEKLQLSASNSSSGTISASFDLSLAKGQYEYEAVNGNVNSAESYSPAPAVIYGKTTSTYEKSYHIPLHGQGPWDIKIKRKTPDSSSQALQNDSYWWGYTEIIEAKFTWPGLAHIGTRLEAEQFGGSIKKVEFEIDGRLLSVPSNYDAETRSYTGIWDGTFQQALSDNPAWVMYDILSNDVYGLGQYIPAELTNKWLLYQIAKYCDELVPNGFGELEPRFTFNHVFRQRDDAFKVVNELLASIRAINYWSGGAIQFSQDAPGDPEMIISQADVIDGVFDYSNTGLKARHSVIYVGWIDPETNAGQVHIVEDAELIQQYGIRPLEVSYKGCTSLGQAHRYGKWILESERIENSLVTFAGGFKFASLMPGALISIADPVIANVRFGGRVKSVSGNDITLDASVTLDSAEAYTLTVTNDDLSLSTANISSPATSDVVTLDELLTPNVGASWLISGTDVAPKQYRVLLNTQQEKNTFAITAIAHDPTKYDRIELDADLTPPEYTAHRRGTILPPLNLNTDEYLYKDGVTVRSAVLISWTAPDDERVSRYEIEVQPPGDEGEETDWENLGTTAEPSITFNDTNDGLYGFRVRSVSGLGQKSEWLTQSFHLLALGAPPESVENFRSQLIDKMIVLSWSAVADLDLSHYQVRHTGSLTPGWEAALIVEDEITTTSLALPVLSGTYLVKAIDTSGVQSLNAAVLSTDITKAFLDLNIVEAVTAGANFPGVKTHTVYDKQLDALRLDTTDDIYAWADITAIDNVYYGETGLAATGYYTLDEIVDLTDIFTSRISADVTLSAANIFNDIYHFTDIYDVQNIYGADAADYGLELQISTSDDMSIWSVWEPMLIGDYTARGLKFRVELTTHSADISPLLEAINISVDMPDRIESKEDTLCPVNGMRFTYSSQFKVKPALAVTAQDMATGDYFNITNQDASGFDIEFFDTTNTSISRTYDTLTKGYGYVTSE